MEHKWTLNKYKLLVNSLRVELYKREVPSEAEALDIATDYLITNPEAKRFIEYNLGEFDVVRKLAEDIGYIK